jgi:hypothetical protein
VPGVVRSLGILIALDPDVIGAGSRRHAYARGAGGSPMRMPNETCAWAAEAEAKHCRMAMV